MTKTVAALFRSQFDGLKLQTSDTQLDPIEQSKPCPFCNRMSYETAEQCFIQTGFIVGFCIVCFDTVGWADWLSRKKIPLQQSSENG